MSTPDPPAHSPTFSPLPWHIHGSFIRDSRGCIVNDEGGTEPGDLEFIVRAVNSHAGLVEALRDAIADSPHDPLCKGEPCDCWRARAKAALKGEK